MHVAIVLRIANSALLFLATGCTPGQTTSEPAKASTSEAQRSGGTMTIRDSIGQATMTRDGTIILDLRAEEPATLGDARLIYPTTHSRYEEVLKHLGGLEPGEQKPVPPWND